MGADVFCSARVRHQSRAVTARDELPNVAKLRTVSNPGVVQRLESISSALAALMLAAVALTAVTLGATVSPAEAHRDGCHAAHSCPSDTGSYVCGDTGIFTYCGYSSIPPPPPPVDYSPPRRPQMSRPLVGPGGLVQLSVRAEPGSNIVVRSAGRIVASATATGEQQKVSFRAATGPHTYFTSATDDAGNQSAASSVTVIADATPPTTRSLVLTPGTSTDSRSHVSLQSDPNTQYVLTVDGRPFARGTAEQGQIETWLPLDNGAHTIVLDLRDKVGNRRVIERDLTVTVPDLEPNLQLESEANESRQTFMLTGTPGSKAKVRVSGQPAQTFKLKSATDSVSFDLSDGVYSNVVASLVDRSGRRGKVALGSFTVDTTAPATRLTRLASRTAAGWLAFAIRGESESSILWRVLGDDDKVVQQGSFIANGSDEEFEFDVMAGDYRVEIIGSDESGNESIGKLEVAVPANPATTSEIVAATAALAVVLLGIVLSGWWYWRNRVRIATWRAARRAAAAQRAVVRRHEAALRAHEKLVSSYESGMIAHQRATAIWKERHEFLIGLVELAQSATGTPTASSSDLKLRRGERVYTAVTGALIDTRTQQGVSQLTLVENGRVTVTSLRVIFHGSKKREWFFDKMEQVRHVADAQTIITVSNRQKPSGVQYADAERTRLFIDLAVADISGGRAPTVTAMKRRAAAHESNRPRPPQHPGPPPPSPAMPPLVPTVAAKL